MAKQKKETKEKPIEVTLWDAANKLRGSVEPADGTTSSKNQNKAEK